MIESLNTRQRGWLVLVSMAVLGGCSGESETEPPAKRLTLAEYQAKVGANAVFDAGPSYYPKLYKKLGKASFNRAMALNDWAALKVVLSDTCDRLFQIDVSDAATRDEIQWFADCENGQRFYVTEPEAKQVKAALEGVAPTSPIDPTKLDKPMSQQERLDSFPEVQAVTDCDALMRSAAKSPSSYKSKMRWSLDNTATPGRVTISRRFEAENAFGVRLEGQYECTVDAVSGQVIKLRAYQNGEWQWVQSE